jgi:hypothetical protein
MSITIRIDYKKTGVPTLLVGPNRATKSATGSKLVSLVQHFFPLLYKDIEENGDNLYALEWKPAIEKAVRQKYDEVMEYLIGEVSGDCLTKGELTAVLRLVFKWDVGFEWD